MPRPKKSKPNRPDGLYEVKVTIGKAFDGKPIRKSFYSSISKEDAQKKAEEYRIQQESAKRSGQNFVANDPPFQSWALKWLEVYKKGTVRDFTYENTYKRIVEKYLIPYFGESRLSEIRPANVQAFYKEMAERYSTSQLKKAKLCLNAIFENAIKNDLCIKNPAKGIHPTPQMESKPKNVYTNQEVVKIMEFAQGHPEGMAVLILLKMGLRRSEMLALTWEDIDFQNQTLSVTKAVSLVESKVTVGPPKSKSSNRLLPMDKQLTSYLAEKRNTKEGPLFPGKKEGSVMSPNNWTNHHYKVFMEDLMEQYPDIKYLTPHELRHTCGTLLYQKTNDIYAVSKFLGHSEIGITTKIYVHSDVESLRASTKMY